MATTSDIPTDTLDLSSNATGFAGAVKTILEFFRDNLGNAAFKGSSNNAGTANDEDLMEKQAFGEGAFRDTGTDDGDLITRADFNTLGNVALRNVVSSDANVTPSEGEVPILDSNAKIPSRVLPDSTNTVYNETIFSSETDLFVSGTDTAPTTPVSINLATNRDINDYQYITMFFSLGLDNVASQSVWSTKISDSLAHKIKIEGNEIGFEKTTAGTGMSFQVLDDFDETLRITAIIGHRV